MLTLSLPGKALSPSLHNAEKSYYFDVSAQPLEPALNQLAAITGIQIVAFSEDILDQEAPELKGEFTLPEALATFLKGRDLSYRVVNARTIAVASPERFKEQNKSIPPPPSNSISQKNETQPEELIVTGSYRNSLHSALAIKRNNTGLADAIVATDIVDFPDQNMAEALQRVPGVAIERDRGLGTRVNIRSLGTQFSKTTINGTTTATGSGTREVDFRVFASELFQSVTIKKSPTAADEEGGVAGEVAMKTPRAFDYEQRRIAGSVETIDSSTSDKRDGRYAFLLSNTFADDRWGALFSYASGSRTARIDEMFEDEFFSLGDRLYERYGTSATAPSDLNPNLIYPEKIESSAEFVEQEHQWLTTSLQFRPNTDMEFTLDLITGTMEEQGDRYHYGIWLGNATAAEDLEINDSLFITSARFENGKHEVKTYRKYEDEHYQQIDLSADWTLGDWKINSLVGYNRAERDRKVHYFRWDTDVNDVIYTLEDHDYHVESSTFNALIGNDLGFNNYDLDIGNVNNDKDTALLDVRRELPFSHWKALTAIQFGTRYTQSHAENSYAFTRVQGSQLTLNPDNSVSSSEEYLGDSIDLLNPTLLSETLPGGINQAYGFSDWRVVSPDAALARYYPRGEFPIELQPQEYYRVDENVLALYAMGDFDFSVFGAASTLNLGLRYVETEQTSFGYENIDGQWSERPVHFISQYKDLLPSLNLQINITDDLLWRFSTAKVLARAQLSELVGSFHASTGNRDIRMGNPSLKPLRANQADISLEWYFADESLIAATTFYKDLKSLISEAENGTMEFRGELYDVTTKVNVEGLKLRGAELIFQMPFRMLDGFGINANYTYVDANRAALPGSDRKIPIKGLSRHAYNITAYYEKHPIDLRASYNYKSESIREETGGYSLFSENYGQWDISAGYKFSEHIKLTLKVINLSNEELYARWEANNKRYPGLHQVYGRRVALGLRATF